MHALYTYFISSFISVHLICLTLRLRLYFTVFNWRAKTLVEKEQIMKNPQSVSCGRNISFNVMVANLLYRQYKFKENPIGNK